MKTIKFLTLLTILFLTSFQTQAQGFPEPAVLKGEKLDFLKNPVFPL